MVGLHGLPKTGKSWRKGLKAPLPRFAQQRAFRLETIQNTIRGIKAGMGVRSASENEPILDKAVRELDYTIEFLGRAITELRFLSRYPSTPEEK